MSQIDATDIRYLRNYPKSLKEIIEDNEGRRTEEYDVIALEWIQNARPYRGLSSFGKMTQKAKDKLNQLYEKIYKEIDDSELERDRNIYLQRDRFRMKHEARLSKRWSKIFWTQRDFIFRFGIQK